MRIFTLSTLLTLAALAISAQTPPAAKKATAAPATAGAKPAAAKPAAAKPTATAAKPATAAAKPAAVQADPNDPVVMTIGDSKVTKKEYEAFIASLPEQVRAQASTDKRAFAERVAELKTLAYEARRRNLDKSPQVQIQMDNVLANELLKTATEAQKPDEAALKAYYDQHKAEFEQVKASHILLRFKGSDAPARQGKKDLTEEEALAKIKELRAKIVGGGDFAAIAKEESDDTGSGANGGSLGQFGHGQMVGPFDQAAFALPVGQISEPVKTQFGYHLIRVDAHGTRTFEEVKAQLENKLKGDVTRQTIESVKKSVPVTYDEAYFAKTPAPAAVPAATPAAPKPATPVK